MRSKLLFTMGLWAAVGCVERAPSLSPADLQRAQPFHSREAPHPQHPLDIRFENGVRLLGYDLDPETLTPGQPFTLTLHWKAEHELEDGWQLFTHIADGRGEDRRNCDSMGQECVTEAIVREVYQPMHWQAGEYVRDVIHGSIQADWDNDRAVIYAGLWNGPNRLRVVSGPNDGNDRARVASISVAPGPTAQRAAPGATPEAPAAPHPPAPTLQVQHATGPIQIDGNLDEADWGRTPRTAHFVNTMDASNPELVATARMLWDDRNLYVAFEVADDYLHNTLTERDAHLWEQDAVELMLDPDGDGRNYFEIQISPTGAVFDTRYDTRRVPQPVGHLDWNAPIQARVQTDGNVNDETADRSYTVEASIPWSAFAVGEPPAQPPIALASWRANMYVMDARPAGQGQRSVGWSPTYEGDFHVPARFGTIAFRPEPQTEQAAAPVAQIPVGHPQLNLSPDALRALREGIRSHNQVDPGLIRQPPTPQQPPQ